MKPETEEKIRKILTSDAPTLLLHLGEMTPREIRTVKAAFGWVLREMSEETN